MTDHRTRNPNQVTKRLLPRAVALGFVLTALVFGERVFQSLRSKGWHDYTPGDGLVHHHVLAIAVAPNGPVWFSTRRGLCRFDGQTWTKLPPAVWGTTRSPIALAIDTRGRVWVETRDGVGVWDERASAPLWVLRAWAFLRLPLLAALLAWAAVLIFESEWGARLARRASTWLRDRWSRFKERASKTWTRLHDGVLAINPRDRLKKYVSCHRVSLAWLALLMLCGLLLRLWRLDYDLMLPYVAHADEQTQYNPAIRMIQTGDFNPHFFVTAQPDGVACS